MDTFRQTCAGESCGRAAAYCCGGCAREAYCSSQCADSAWINSEHWRRCYLALIGLKTRKPRSKTSKKSTNGAKHDEQTRRKVRNTKQQRCIARKKCAQLETETQRRKCMVSCGKKKILSDTKLRDLELERTRLAVKKINFKQY